jgi:hypothetical protein
MPLDMLAFLRDVDRRHCSSSSSSSDSGGGGGCCHLGEVVRPTFLVLSARNIDQRDADTRFYSAFCADSRLTRDFCSDVEILVFIGGERLDYVSLSTALELFNENTLRKVIIFFDVATALADAPVIDVTQLCDVSARKRLLFGRVVRDLVCGAISPACECCPLDPLLRSPVAAAISRLRGTMPTLTLGESVLSLEIYDASDEGSLQRMATKLMLTRDAESQISLPDLFVVIGPHTDSGRLSQQPLIQRLASKIEEVTRACKDMDPAFNLADGAPSAGRFVRFAKDEQLIRVGDIVRWSSELPFSLLQTSVASDDSAKRLVSSAGYYIVSAMYASRNDKRSTSDQLEIRSLSRSDRMHWFRSLYPQRKDTQWLDYYIHFELAPLDRPCIDLPEKLQRTLRVNDKSEMIQIPFWPSCCVTPDHISALGPVANLIVLYDSDAYNGAQRVLQTMHLASSSVTILASNQYAEGKLLDAQNERPITTDRLDYYSPLACLLRKGA